MTELIIRDLDDSIWVQLKRRAWEQGLPLHEAVRRLIIASIESDDSRDGTVILMSPSRLREAARAGRIDRRIALHS